MLLRDVKHNSVKTGIEFDLAGQAALRSGSLGKLEQVGLHAVIGKASDPVDPRRIDLDVTSGTCALTTAIAVDAGNIVEQRCFARRQSLANFDRKPVAIVSYKGDLDHFTWTFPWRTIQCA